MSHKPLAISSQIPASLQQNNVLGANTLQGIQTITGYGANSIALGTTSNNLGVKRTVNSIASLI